MEKPFLVDDLRRLLTAVVWLWIIHLKKDDPFTTQRFTLFHEVFHILAHHRNTPASRKRGHRETPFTELLANYFAACVLMPRK